MSHLGANLKRPEAQKDALSLGIAFIGFTETAKSRVFDWIEPLCGKDAWRESKPEFADAICVHEAAVATSDEASVSLHRKLPDSPIRTDNPLRPVAVASRSDRPVPGCIIFDFESQYSVINLFRALEARVGVIRSEFAMGAALANKRVHVESGGVFHLMHAGRLAAIADLTGRVFGARSPVHADVLLNAEWHKRPDSAAEMPEGFVRRSLADLLWTYTSRSKFCALPVELRTSRISLRKLPQVPMDRLNPLHIQVMASIQREHKMLDELYDEIGGMRSAVDRSVGALYYSGVLSLSRPSSLQRLASRLLAATFRTRSQGLETARQIFLREKAAPLIFNPT